MADYTVQELPKQIKMEIENAGLTVDKTVAVEGPTWIIPSLDTMWEKEGSRKTILKLTGMVEEDENIIVISPHKLTIANKSNSYTLTHRRTLFVNNLII